MHRSPQLLSQVPYFAFDFRVAFALGLDFGLALGLTRSGSFAPPVSRFHSSKVWFEILPSTSSCANFLRCAWLLNGMSRTRREARIVLLLLGASLRWPRKGIVSPFRETAMTTRPWS